MSAAAQPNLSGTLSMYDGDGNLVAAPVDRVRELGAKGYRAALYDPKGNEVAAPVERMAELTRSGYTTVPMTPFEQERQPQNQEGFLAHSAGVIGNQLKSAVLPFLQPWKDAANAYQSARAQGGGVLRSGAEALGIAAISPDAHQAIDSAQQELSEENAGRSWPYRHFIAPAASGVGVNVGGMEHQADIGNRSGVLSEGAVPAAEAVTGAAIARGARGGKPAPDTTVSTSAPAEPSVTAGTAEQKGAGLTGGFAEKFGVVDPPPKSLITRAVKPLSSNSGWDAAISKAMPDMKAAETELGHPIQGVDDALSAVNVAKKKIWAQYSAKVAQANARPDPNAIAESLASMSSETPFAGAGGATIDGNTIADAMVNSIDRRTALQNPSFVKQISSIADTYRRPLSLDEAEDFLQSANNDLNSYYAKNKVGRQVAQRDPSTGYIVAEADALRDGLYSKLDELSGPGARQLKQRYGALSNVEGELLRRKNVAARQQPVSLAEQMAMSGGAGDILRPDRLLNRAQNIAVARWLKNYGSADAMIARAFQKTGGAGVTEAPSPRLRPGAAVPAAAVGSNPGRTNSDIFDEGLQMYRQAHARL